MRAVVNIIHPLLGLIMLAEWLRILERLLCPFNQQPCWVILDFIQYSMRQHSTSCQPTTMLGDPGFHPVLHKTTLFLLQYCSLKCSGHRIECHSKLEQMILLLPMAYLTVLVDIITRNSLWPVPPFLNQE
jgi:hypothetical protein